MSTSISSEFDSSPSESLPPEDCGGISRFEAHTERARVAKHRPPTLSLSRSPNALVHTSSGTTRSRTSEEVFAGKGYGVVSRKGRRRAQREDFFFVSSLVPQNEDTSSYGIFGVFDGHGGQRAAQFASTRIPELLLKGRPECESQARESMRGAFLRTDEEFNKGVTSYSVNTSTLQKGLGGRTKSGGLFGSIALQSVPWYRGGSDVSGSKESSKDGGESKRILHPVERKPGFEKGQEDRRLPGGSIESCERQALLAEDCLSSFSATVNPNCGTTATVVILMRSWIVIAQVGDSRAVMSASGKARRIFEDQRPSRLDEQNRIESAGGLILHVGGTDRVNGVLAVSRAIGDPDLKEFVVAEPETTSLEITDEDDFIVIASDGLWDKVADQECIDYIQSTRKNDNCTLTAIGSGLVALACERGSTDDVTVLVVDLLEYKRILFDVEASEASAVSPQEIGHEKDEETPPEHCESAEVSACLSLSEEDDFVEPTPRNNARDVDCFADPAPTPRNRHREKW